MNDTQVVDWIEEYLVSLFMDINENMEMRFFDLEGVERLVTGASLRDCVREAIVAQKGGDPVKNEVRNV